MNFLKRSSITTVICLGFTACHQKAVMDKKPDVKEATPPPAPPAQVVEPPPPPPTPQKTEPQKIIEVLQNMYRWHATQSGVMDFPLVDNGEKYTGLNQAAFANRITQLQQTKIFAVDFLTAYHHLGQEIHRRLATGAMEYWVGDMPPFGNGASPWTNAQDTPDQFWQQMRIQNFQIQGDRAQFTWHWPLGYGDQPYWVGMKKEQDQWRIRFLQGFDIRTFFPK